MADVQLLGGVDIRELASRLDVTPTKKLGQNFVTDPNTIRRIVTAAKLTGVETVVEIGPGLGSLTLGLLEVAKKVIAVEIDPVKPEITGGAPWGYEAMMAMGLVNRWNGHTPAWAGILRAPEQPLGLARSRFLPWAGSRAQ